MRILTEYEAEKLLSDQGFPLAYRKLFTTEKEAYKEAEKLNFNIVLKIASPKILHKTELKGVKLGITKENFSKNYKALDNLKIPKQGILLQEYVEGLQLIIGIKKDPVFGHVLLLGLGGIYTELFKDTSLRVLPLEKKDVHSLLEELKIYPLLKGYRGEKYNLKHLEKILLHFNDFVKKYPTLQELDINPLIINEKKVTFVDARLIFN